MVLTYSIEPEVAAEEVARVFMSAGMKRPSDDLDRIGRMIAHGDVIVCARDDGRLVGVARSITDFSYCCYLSDLAVDVDYQRRGIGKELIRLTREAIGPECTLLLQAAATAEGYYPHLGFQPVDEVWMIRRER